MIRLEMKNCDMILTEKQQKYQHYHLEKLMNMNILQVKKYYLPIEERFTYYPLGKALEKQTRTIKDQVKKQIKAIQDHGKQLVESYELIKKEFNIKNLLKKDLINLRL